MHVPDPFLQTEQNLVMMQLSLEATIPEERLTYLVRDRTPVTGELVEWLPLLTEPGSLLSGGLQYVVRFAPLLPPAIADTPTTHSSLV